MDRNLNPVPNNLPMVVQGTQLEVIETKTEQELSRLKIEYTTIFKPLNLLVGEMIAIFEEDNIGETSVADISVGFYTEKDGFYLVTHLKNKPKMLKRLTNFIFKPTKKLIQRDFNNSEFSEHMYEVLFLVEDNYFTARFLYEELFKLNKFEKKMATITHILTSIDERTFRDFMAIKLSEIKDLPCVVEFKTAG